MSRERGHYGSPAGRWWTTPQRPVTQVGQSLFHTVSDRERALAHLSTGFRSLASDLAVWQAANPDAGALAQWITADVIPTLQEWDEFVTYGQQSWWTRAAISWDAFEDWCDRLKQLRSLARAHGVVLQSSEPMPLPTTIWQRTAAGTGTEAAAVLGVLKIGALSALAIMGAAGLYDAIRNLGSRATAADDKEALREILREELDRERDPLDALLLDEDA